MGSFSLLKNQNECLKWYDTRENMEDMFMAKEQNFIIKTGRRPHMKSSSPLGMNAVIF